MTKTKIQVDNQPPLCVDVDGTLIRTDLLYESTFVLLKKNVLNLFRIPIWLLKGKAHLKSQIASRVAIDATVLPYNDVFLDFLRERHKSGQQLIIATASHTKYAQAISDHLGIFDRIFASDETTNLSGKTKVERLIENFGERGFDYAGNGFVDKKIWEHARQAIIVNGSRGLEKSMPAGTPIARVFDDRPARVPEYLRAMRPHQWLKNLLLFVPLFLSHQIAEPELLLKIFLAFLSFGLCASSVYLLNDLLDLQDDRHHATKRRRPFAAGSISILGGTILIPVLLAGSAAIAFFLPLQFQLVLLLYYVITMSYSIRLKQPAIIDVLVLASLYTIRIIAGAAAILVEPSFWLLAFSMFLFLSLAILKRFTELSSLGGIGMAKGRGYRVADLETLAQFGTASAYVAVLVLALYIDDQSALAIYQYPKILWVLCPMMLYLVSRAWLLARRGELHEDPVVFLMRDRRSQAFIGLGALAILAAV